MCLSEIIYSHLLSYAFLFYIRSFYTSIDFDDSTFAKIIRVSVFFNLF